jgi:hypothetical protein
LKKGILQVQRFSSLIESIYDAVYTGNWNTALDMMIDVTKSNKVFFFLRQIDSDKPMMMEFRANFNYPAHVIPEFQARVEEDPFYNAIQSAPEGEFIDCNALVDINL